MATFVFPGQGSQNRGMGAGLFEQYRELTAEADQMLGYSVKEICLEDPANLLNRTQYTQPVLYVVNALSYLRALEETGIRPDYVLGHSLGEYTALFASGAFSFAEGLEIVKKRGELMARAKDGAMAAVIGLEADRVVEVLKENDFGSIDIANYNTPCQTVIAGPKVDIHHAKGIFEQIGKAAFVLLDVGGAFHSRYMKSAKKAFSSYLKGVEFNDLTIPVISNLKAAPYSQSEIRHILVEHISSPVRWNESIKYLMDLGETDFREVGPGRVLTGLIKATKACTVNSGDSRDENIGLSPAKHAAIFLKGEIYRHLEDLLLPIFNSIPLDKQPGCLVVTGWGDTELTSEIYETIANRSVRGRAFNRYPLRLIMVDPKKRSQAGLSFKSLASLAGKHGLIVLGVHRSSAIGIGRPTALDRCERLAPDLIVASYADMDGFFLSAAQAGLFAETEHPGAYGGIVPNAILTINHLKPREYVIRQACNTDLASLVALEKQCWETSIQIHSSELEKRIKRYPEGQLVLEMEGRVVGVIYSQRIADTSQLTNANMYTVERLHQRNGPIVHLLAVNILPDMQNRNIGDQLLEFMLQLSAVRKDVSSVVAVTLCKKYHQYPNIAMQDYIRLRNDLGKLADPTLRFHELHGARIREAIPDYRPQDQRNEGYGVLVEYDIRNRRRDNIEEEDGPYNLEPSVVNSNHNEFVIDSINSILGKEKKGAFAIDRPLMEMGMDSADLLELKERITSRYNTSLDPIFFFKYNTPELVISFLNEHKTDTVPVIADNAPTFECGEKKINTKQKKGSVDNYSSENRGIAIVGASCRLPRNVRDKVQLWEMLKAGRDVITRGTRLEWPPDIDIENEHRGINFGGFLDEIDAFDAGFFRISRREAELMDPQQRIMLELTWECIEDAGYSPRTLSGSRTGVFIGASGSDYHSLLIGNSVAIEAHQVIGTSMAVLPNRISYFYDLNGPSLQIDTACSSSLVAVHEAVRSLREGECEQALVGGVNIICHPCNSISYYKAGMLSKEGKCKTFDKAADGYVRGEGAVMLFLKPLEKAVEEKDEILCVLGFRGRAERPAAQSMQTAGL